MRVEKYIDGGEVTRRGAGNGKKKVENAKAMGEMLMTLKLEWIPLVVVAIVVVFLMPERLGRIAGKK